MNLMRGAYSMINVSFCFVVTLEGSSLYFCNNALAFVFLAATNVSYQKLNRPSRVSPSPVYLSHTNDLLPEKLHATFKRCQTVRTADLFAEHIDRYARRRPRLATNYELLRLSCQTQVHIVRDKTLIV